MANDLYAVLGVSRDASQKEIRQAYRRLARQYHPDVNPGNAEAEARFKEINRAHEVLSDPDKRQKYDRYGDQWEHADQIEEMRRRQRAGANGPFTGPGGATYETYEFDLEDLADLGFGGGGFGGGERGAGGFGGVFEQFFRRGGRTGGRAGARPSGRRRGQDLEHTVAITLEEAYSGTRRTVEVYEGEERCPVCGGTGTIAGATCHNCRGSGNVAPVRRIEVDIPPGVDTGTRVRVAGKGGAGVGGGPPGDLFLRVQVRPHPRFERRGDDLRVTVDVPAYVAVLGGEVRVPTLKGRTLALTIPPGTQSGKVFRLAGQGMPRQRHEGGGGGFGDLHARVQVTVPEHPTDEQRAAFERLRELDERSGDGRADGREARRGEERKAAT